MKATRTTRWLLAVSIALVPVLAPSFAHADTAVTASNESDDTDTESGEAVASNSSSGIVGHSSGQNTVVGTQDVTGSSGQNIQDGDNEITITQQSNVRTGDAVGGQIIGAVVGQGGNLRIDASNRSEDVDIETGEATGTNESAAFVGLAATGTEEGSQANVGDIEDVVGVNIQEGDNEANIDQSVDVSTGDGIAGQVIGANVGGGTTDIVAENHSEDVDIETGGAEGTNDMPVFVGLNSSSGTSVGDGVSVTDVSNATGVNVQEGDNEFDASQSVQASSGNGIGGQVLGVNSAGDTSVDASNTTEDADIESGFADGSNAGAAFVGLNSSTATEVAASDIEDSSGTNLQDGDNEASLDQAASAVTGEAIAGQVAGITVSAGGSADVVLENFSMDADLQSGESTIDNLQEIFTGLNTSTETLTVGGSSSLDSIFQDALV